MPNQLPLSNLGERLGLQHPAPISVRMNGKVVPVEFKRSTNWNKIAFCVFILLFVVIPLVLGIMEMIRNG